MSPRLREALRTPARLIVIDLERRGFRFRLRDGRIEVAPRTRLTNPDRAAVREQADAIRVLVEFRPEWSAWPQPVPTFDPSRAFLEPGDVPLLHERQEAS